MARPLDCLIGAGLAPSPYIEMRNERDALRLIAGKMAVSLKGGLETPGSSEPDWSKSDRALIKELRALPVTR